MEPSRPGNGSYAFVGRNGLTASTGFAVLWARALEFAPVVYCVARRPENINRLALEADGGAYPAVRPEAVIRTEFPKPSGEVMIRFGEICLPFLQKIEADQSEMRTLAALLFLGCSLCTDRTFLAVKEIKEKSIGESVRHYAFLPFPGADQRHSRGQQLAQAEIYPIYYLPEEHDQVIEDLLITMLEGAPE